MQIQYSIFTYPVIQSRGEEQGKATGGGEVSGRKEQRAGEGTDLGGWGGCREEQRREADGSLQGGGREADGSPAGRRSCRVGGGQGPCRPQGGLGAAGGGRRGGWRRRRRRRDASRGTLEADALAQTIWARLLIPAPATPFPRHSFLPPAHAPTFFSTFTP